MVWVRRVIHNIMDSFGLGWRGPSSSHRMLWVGRDLHEVTEWFGLERNFMELKSSLGWRGLFMESLNVWGWKGPSWSDRMVWFGSDLHSITAWFGLEETYRDVMTLMEQIRCPVIPSQCFSTLLPKAFSLIKLCKTQLCCFN